MADKQIGDVWVLSLDIPDHVRGRIDIWLDPVTQKWCVGPPHTRSNTAVRLMQVSADVFAMERSHPA